MYSTPYYYPNSPAIQTAQQRLQSLEAQYPQFAQQPMGYPPQNPQQPQTMVKGRPVSNEDEANAAMIDFDGSLFIFPDKAHGKIYTKQLGLDGNIVFLKYSLDQTPNPAPAAVPAPENPGYVTQEELSASMTQMKDYITQQLDSLTKPKEV